MQHLTESKHKYQTIILIKKGLNIQAGQRPCKRYNIQDLSRSWRQESPSVSFQAKSKQQEKLGQTLSSVCMILLRKTSLHSSAKQQQSYTSLCQHTAVQQSETQDWPESSTEGIKWLIQLFNTAMLAPSHWQISTTVYLHAQFVASFATCDSVPTLASRRVWHFIIAKLRNGKFCFMFFFLSRKGLKRQQHSAPCRNHRRRRMHCNRLGKKQAQVSLCLRHSGSLLISKADTPAVIAAAANTENTITWRSGQRKS